MIKPKESGYGSGEREEMIPLAKDYQKYLILPSREKVLWTKLSPLSFTTCIMDI
jgi:hypothetical protein